MLIYIPPKPEQEWIVEIISNYNAYYKTLSISLLLGFTLIGTTKTSK